MLSMDAFSSLATRRGAFSPGAGLVMSCDTYGHDLTNTTRTGKKKKKEITRRVTADGTRRAFRDSFVCYRSRTRGRLRISRCAAVATKPVQRIIKSNELDTNLAS